MTKTNMDKQTRKDNKEFMAKFRLAIVVATQLEYFNLENPKWRVDDLFKIDGITFSISMLLDGEKHD